MDRPLGITVTTCLMCLTNALGFFLVDRSAPGADLTIELYAIFIVLGYAVLWFYWRGKNWARWLVIATSVLCLWNVWELRNPPTPYDTPVRVPMTIAEGVIALFLLWYLNTESVRAWFTAQK